MYSQWQVFCFTIDIFYKQDRSVRTSIRTERIALFFIQACQNCPTDFKLSEIKILVVLYLSESKPTLQQLVFGGFKNLYRERIMTNRSTKVLKSRKMNQRVLLTHYIGLSGMLPNLEDIRPSYQKQTKIFWTSSVW